MRIKELHILRYGSRLRDFHQRFEKDFTIIFGPNGSGKTLIIDAILKLLIGTSANAFIRHIGIEENPEGFIVVEERGDQHKFDGKTVLPDAGIDISPDELKSIFVIEDGDLNITDQDEFYGRVTDKLIGVRTKDIQEVKKALRERGRLTPTLKVGDKAPLHTASKLKDAKELKEEIEAYLEKAESSGRGGWEGKRLSLESSVMELDGRIEIIAKAGKRDEFEKLDRSLTEAEDILGELETFPQEEQLVRLRGELGKLNEEIPRRPELEENSALWQTVFKYSIIVAPIVLIAFLILGLVSAVLPILAIGSLGLVFFSLYRWQTTRMSLAEIVRMERSIVEHGGRMGWDVDNPAEVSEKIRGIDGKKGELKDKFERIRGVMIDRFQIKEGDKRKFLEGTRSELEKLRKGVDFSVAMPYDKEEPERLRGEREEAREELRRLNEELEEHQRRLKEFSQRAQSLKCSDEFSTFELDLQIDNLESLRELVGWLESFITNIERDADLSRIAHEIFEELESKEKKKSENLFQEGNRASQILKEITDGMFLEVRYNVEEREIFVNRRNQEKPQKASELSIGEWTQLYIAIRVALGERLLEGEKGFFIVEEPFIHTDPERLVKQFEMLKKLSDAGWQMIYFTAKEEIKRGLPKYLEAELIELERLP